MIMKALFIRVAMLAGIVGLSTAEASSRNYYELRIYLTPHTARQGSGRHWKIAPQQIEFLKLREKYMK